MRCLLCYITLLLSIISTATAQTITTLAGNGYYSYSGDGGMATACQMKGPDAIAVDAGGNRYISDRFNNCIRKISSSGIITTIAGTTVPNYSGDGGNATTATVSYPCGLTVDAGGNLYIADNNNHVIRKISTAGIITTVAGSNRPGNFGNNGPATNALLYGPNAVALDATGNLYIADQNNNVIKMVNTAGIIIRFAGTGGLGFSGDNGPATDAQMGYPSGVTTDAAGNVYVMDYYNSRIRKISPSGYITTIAGTSTSGYSGDGGPATNAELFHPYGMCIDATNTIYFSDCGNNCIRKISAGGIITTIAGDGNANNLGDGGPASAAELFSPKQIIKDAGGNLYFCDSGSNKVRKINAAGIISAYAGGLGNGTMASAHALNPINAVIGPDKSLYVVDADNNRVCKIDKGGIINTVVGNLTSGYSGDGGPATDAQLSYPTGVAFNKHGEMFVVEQGNSVVRRVTTGGTITTFAGTGSLGYTGDGGPATNADMHEPFAIATDTADNVYVCDQVNNCVRKITPGGIISTYAGSGTLGYSGDNGPATAAQMKRTSGIQTDLNGNIFIADLGNGAVRKVDRTGTITTVAGTGTPGFTATGLPATTTKMAVSGLAVDSSGNIYLSEGTHRCRAVNALGIVTPIAGNGLPAITGDGGPATAAQLHGPSGITVDDTGTLYIMDYDNYRIRKVQSSKLPPILLTGAVCVGATSSLTDAAPGGTWTSFNTAIATVNTSTGAITGVATGTATIIYALNDRTIATTITVNTLPSAGTITGVSAVCQGASINLTDATTGGIWSTSNGNAAVSGGTVSGISGGTCTISYSVTNMCGTASATKTVTVNPLPAAGAIAGASSVCKGSSITMSNAVTGGIWSTASTTIALAGSTVTGLSAGTAIVSYTTTNSCGNTTVTATITVNPLPDAGTINGAPNVCTGAATTLTDAAAGGIWSTANTTISLSGNVINGLATGTATISYAVTTICGTATATRSIIVLPLPHADTIRGAAAVCKSASVTLTDTAAGGAWNRTNANAFVSGGVVTGLTPGTDTILYTVTNACGAATATFTITINPPTVAGAITGPSSVCEGARIAITDPVTGGVWTSANTNTSITTSGVVTGIAAGTGILQYTVTGICGSATATKAVTVDPLPAAAVLTGPGNVCPGKTVVWVTSEPIGTWSATNGNAAVAGGVITGINAGTDTIQYITTNLCGSTTVSHTITIDATPTIMSLRNICEQYSDTIASNMTGGTWNGDNNAVATIDMNSGIINGIHAGTLLITYISNAGCAATATVIVIATPPAIGGAQSVCVNATAILSDATTGGTWKTANHSLADIDPAIGVITGVAGGLVSITYTDPTGCYTSTLIRVNPLTEPGVITGNSKVCADSTLLLSDSTGTGVWASSPGTIVTISASGVVTPRAAGTDTILYTVTGICGAASARFPVSVTNCSPTNVDATLKVTPSPNDGNFTVLFSSPVNEPATMIISNLPGQKILELPITSNISVPVAFGAMQASGTYFVTVAANGKKYVEKVVVIH